MQIFARGFNSRTPLLACSRHVTEVLKAWFQAWGVLEQSLDDGNFSGAQVRVWGVM